MSRIQTIAGPTLTLCAVVAGMLALAVPVVRIGVEAAFRAMGY